MNEIKCPNCGEIFSLEEPAYARIAQQVRNQEFEKEVKLLRAEMEGRAEQIAKGKVQEESLQMKEEFERQLKEKDEIIERYKNFKLSLSTKAIGESLEVYCQNEFNKWRMTAFPNAYFDKDNDAKEGSKGDFIFRDYEDGVEYISIMFEMKNQADDTIIKHKNKEFFKKLDADRNKKECEYAVLVSMLEEENDYYNGGIVDVSYEYPKMYVIRPQFFMPMITLLRNAARKTLETRRELEKMREQQLDVENFETKLLEYKDYIHNKFDTADKQFETAIKNIDKAIQQLEETKEYLIKSKDNIEFADKKADSITIRKLVKNSPTVKTMFGQVQKNEP